MCVGCAAAYAAIAASTVTYSMTDLYGKEPGFQFMVSSDALAEAAIITTTPSGTASITIKSAAPVAKKASGLWLIK
jgi:hypothetical protein